MKAIPAASRSARLPYVVDQETCHGALVEVFVLLVAGTEHLDLVPVGQPEDREVRLLVYRVKAESISEKPDRGVGVSGSGPEPDQFSSFHGLPPLGERGSSRSVVDIPDSVPHGQRAGLVAAARQIACNECKETRYALFGERTVADVLVGEGFLVHAGAHVAWVYAVDAQVRVLGREDVGELLERGLTRAVAAPAFVRLDRGVASHVDDARILLQFVPEYLDEREGRERIRPVNLLEHVERVVEQGRLGARAEDARVVDERVKAANLAHRVRQRRPVLRVGDVSGYRDHASTFRQLGAGSLQGVL